MSYDKAYFITKFEAIPEDKWTTRVYQSLEGKCCAMGHCGVRGMALHDTAESEALDLLFGNTPYIATQINDGKYPEYQQGTPKQRILAALRDLP